MAYQPRFTITAHLLAITEEIAAFREKILAATVQVPCKKMPVSATRIALPPSKGTR